MNDCRTEFKLAMPHKVDEHTPVAKFNPLVDEIEKHTQAAMFRHTGRYKTNGDYYELAHDLDDQGKDSGTTKFKNGVTAEVYQTDGWPTQLILEDKGFNLKETVTLDETHRITSDKVTFCGVSRTREFSPGGESYRSYSFPGGAIEQSGQVRSLKLDPKK